MVSCVAAVIEGSLSWPAVSGRFGMGQHVLWKQETTGFAVLRVRVLLAL